MGLPAEPRSGRRVGRGSHERGGSGSNAKPRNTSGRFRAPGRRLPQRSPSAVPGAARPPAGDVRGPAGRSLSPPRPPRGAPDAPLRRQRRAGGAAPRCSHGAAPPPPPQPGRAAAAAPAEARGKPGPAGPENGRGSRGTGRAAGGELGAPAGVSEGLPGVPAAQRCPQSQRTSCPPSLAPCAPVCAGSPEGLQPRSLSQPNSPVPAAEPLLACNLDVYVIILAA